MSLTNIQISEIRSRLRNGEKGYDLAKEFGVSDSFISQIKHHKKCTKQIWLTLDEAETIEHIIAIYQHYYNIFDGEMKVWQELRKRIEEARKKND